MEKHQFVCDQDFKCPEWEKGMEQIEAIRTLLAEGLKFTGEYVAKPFVFCPWCGRKINREKLSRNKV